MSSLNFLQSTSLAQLQKLIDRVGIRCPALAERATKAGSLLMAGQVRPLRPDVFEVRGSAEQPYTVDLPRPAPAPTSSTAPRSSRAAAGASTCSGP